MPSPIQIRRLPGWHGTTCCKLASVRVSICRWLTWGGGTSFGWGDIETASLDPTPAGLAYSEVYRWVVGATLSSPCLGAANGTWTCTMTRPGGYLAQAVWNTTGAANYAPSVAYTRYRDLAGNVVSVAPGATVPIGAKPVLIEGSTAVPATIKSFSVGPDQILNYPSDHTNPPYLT